MSPDGLPTDPLAYRGLDPTGLDRTGLGRPVGDPAGAERPVGERPESAGVLSTGSAPLLDVRDLSVSFATREGEVRAVDGVTFGLGRGEVLAIVGESGSGKSVCAMTLMGLTRGPNTTISGRALFEGRDLIGASEAQLRRIRGAELAMVFQDPQVLAEPGLPGGRPDRRANQGSRTIRLQGACLGARRRTDGACPDPQRS